MFQGKMSELPVLSDRETEGGRLSRDSVKLRSGPCRYFPDGNQLQSLICEYNKRHIAQQDLEPLDDHLIGMK